MPCARPPLRTWPETQACALTGNRTRDPFLRRPTFNPLSYTSQGSLAIFDKNLNMLDSQPLYFPFINHPLSLCPGQASLKRVQTDLPFTHFFNSKTCTGNSSQFLPTLGHSLLPLSAQELNTFWFTYISGHSM